MSLYQAPVFFQRTESEVIEKAAAMGAQSGVREVEAVTGVVRSECSARHICGAAPWKPFHRQLHNGANTLTDFPFSVLSMCPNSSVVFDVDV